MGDEQKFLLPAPHEVLLAFRTNGPAIWQAAINTASGAFFGFAFAVVIVMMAWKPTGLIAEQSAERV